MADSGFASASEGGRGVIPVARYCRRAALGVLLLAPMCLTMLWACYLYRENKMPLTGDEPHYLLIADSISRDGDLNVRNNYEDDAAGLGKERILQVADWKQHLGGHLQQRGGVLYSKHEAGLGLLVALPFALYGSAGAKFTMVFLLGLTPFLFFWVARRIVGHSGWALLIVLTMSIGLPCSLASIHIYADMLAGLLILVAAECIYREWKAGPSERSVGRILLMVFALFLLPWLKVAYVLPVGICVAVALAVQLTKGMSRESVKYACLSAIPALSILLFFFYLKSLFGYFSHPNMGTTRIGLLALNSLLRLHVDVCHGIFFQQPLLLLGVIGFTSLLRRDWRFGLFLLLLYGSLIGPNATVIGGCTGFCPMGRYTWSTYPLWIYPVCTLFVTLRPGGRRLFGGLCLAAAGPQVLRALTWVPQPVMTYHPLCVPAVFSRYTDYLPDFQMQQPNVIQPPLPPAPLATLIGVWLGLIVLLALWGLVWERPSRRLFSGVLVVYALLGASWMYASAHTLRKEVWEAEDGYMQETYVSVESCNVLDSAASKGKARHCAPEDAQGRPFCLVFGPYANLPAGNTYRVDFYLKIGKARPNEVVATLDVTDGTIASEQASRVVLAKEFAQPLVYQVFSGTFAVSRPLNMVQYRVHWSGKAELWVDRIEVSIVPSA